MAKKTKKTAKTSPKAKKQLHTPTNPAKGEHAHTNRPRLQEMSALTAAQSPSNAHKVGPAKPKATAVVAPPHPMGTKGPIAETVGGVNKKRNAKLRETKVS